MLFCQTSLFSDSTDRVKFCSIYSQRYPIFHPLEPSNDTVPLKEMEAVRGAVMKTLQFPEPGVDQEADVGKCQLGTTIIYVMPVTSPFITMVFNP